MDLEEEILDDFFSKLDSANLPPKTIEKLKKMRQNNELGVVDKIIEVFREESADAENKGN